MAFNWDLRVPYRYRGTYITLRDLNAELARSNFLRSSRRRHLALLHSRGGKLGVGGHTRVCPHPVSQASRNCESFHQIQEFWANLAKTATVRASTAIDYVWEDGDDANDWHDVVPTGGVPVQGSAEARRFGIHANVGTPGSSGFESWHGQPIEIDGFRSATGNRSHPAPYIDEHYPLPPEHDPFPDDIDLPPQEPTMIHVPDYAQRIFDTRDSEASGLPSWQSSNLARFKAGESRDVIVARDDALDTVFVNITVIEPDGGGFVTVYGGQKANVPGTSNVSWLGKGGVHENSGFIATHGDHIHIYAHVGCEIAVDLQAVQARA